MQLKTNPERVRKVALLVEYVNGCVDGQELTWAQLGAAMARNKIDFGPHGEGRQLFREACHKAKRVYLKDIGIGVRFSSPESTLEVMAEVIGDLGGKAKLADRKRLWLNARHGDAYDEPTRKAMRTLDGLCATVKVLVAEGKRGLFSQPPKPSAALPPHATDASAVQKATLLDGARALLRAAIAEPVG